MFETFLKIFLYILIISCLFFLVLYALSWLLRRQPLFNPKQIWSDIINLLTGVLGLWLLKSATLGGEVVFLLVGFLLIGSFLVFYWKEFIASFRR